ncbi:MAG: DUF885 domain-containing protein [Gammaproteobacteria bacterium]|nr:DUF885 domain-containing protein [Gammaproteobacteria bacterium]MYF65992.1 DUF885 domain-containing protein [Gammaproteobacteria bacterium]MYK37575.1 DUF885 domain-containing protein [Gammaproteobacteria bacterium]
MSRGVSAAGWVLAVLLTAGVAPAGAQPVTAEQQLDELLAEEWAARLRENPLLATSMGVSDYNDRLPGVSVDDIERRKRKSVAYADRLNRIDVDLLPVERRMDRELFEWMLRTRIESASFYPERIPFIADSGFHSGLLRATDGVSFRKLGDYDDYLQRLRAIPRYVDQNIENMRAGIADGFVAPRVVLESVLPTVTAPAGQTVAQSAFFAPLRRLPDAIADADRARLEAEAREVIGRQALPALGRLAEFLDTEYRLHVRDSIGASELPGGAEYYRQRIRAMTTLDLSPDEIHEIGLSEVARIRSEMLAIVEELQFEGGIDAFVTFLRTDPRFYAETAEQLIGHASRIAKKVDGILPGWFNLLPRTPYGIMPMPAEMAPTGTTARYWSAPRGGNRGGYYWLNTYALDQRPLYELPALTVHEAVPGHHLQIALARELEDVPEFRRTLGFTAFVEGWALYTEWLGIEMGVYTTPYEHFGRLSYEMWRACRLVIDSGIHAKGWTRDRAVAFLADNTSLSLTNVENEINRYIAWPGQALGYKLGELKIKELRRRAEDALGSEFDVRAFHDAVLANGALPLPILERQIDRFIARSLNAR